MECPVCLETRARTSLVCGHTMCFDCIQKWCTKGCNDGCPMCRRPIFFKGMRKCRERWSDEREETALTEILGETIDNVIEEYLDIMECMDDSKWVLRHMMESLKEVESSFNHLKLQGADPEQMDYMLNESGHYFSFRRARWLFYDADPINQYWDDKNLHYVRSV